MKGIRMTERDVTDDVHAPNRMVLYLFKSNKRGKQFDLSWMWSMYEMGLFTKDDMIEFYQLIGSSKSVQDELFEETDDGQQAGEA